MNNYEPPGNKGVTINGRQITEQEKQLLRDALGLVQYPKLTVHAGSTTTLPAGSNARVEEDPDATDTAQRFNFFIPTGPKGLDGIGSVEAVEAVAIPYGQAPAVVDVGTVGHTKLRFFLPPGPPGPATESTLPPGATDETMLAYRAGAYRWVPIPNGSGTGTGGGTTINNTTIVNNTDSIQGAYAWESGGVVIPPVDPTPTPQTVFDTTSFTAYQAAVAAAVVGAKRVAGANAIITAFGTAQKLKLKKDGVVILTADYAGSMTQSTSGIDITVVLVNMTTVSPIVVADPATGVWTMEISGGTNFARTITLPAAFNVATAIGDGFNPGPITLIIPRSLDGV
jgi:hypothetical protein